MTNYVAITDKIENLFDKYEFNDAYMTSLKLITKENDIVKKFEGLMQLRVEVAKIKPDDDQWSLKMKAMDLATRIHLQLNNAEHDLMWY